MATYKKRGHKPKDKAEQEIQDIQDSTTAEVFSTLDESASRTEAFISRYQNQILIGIALIALGVIGYLSYNQLVIAPRNREAANEFYYPQKHMEEALTADASGNTQVHDSLLDLALMGDAKYGFLDIMDVYPGTKTAELAAYSAGMSYLRLGQYKEAIIYLEKYNGDNKELEALAQAGIGDAFMGLEQVEDAYEYYQRAIKVTDNEFVTPINLFKAGVAALELEKRDEARDFFDRLYEKYPDSPESANAQGYRAMLE